MSPPTHLGPPASDAQARLQKRVPYLDLALRDPGERARLVAAVEKVLSHGRLVLGPEVGLFEELISRRVGVAHAIGVGSGTDALLLALRAAGIGPGDEVVTSPFTFVATANAIRLVGATPVFADIGPDLGIDPSSIEERLSTRTRAILPVHYGGKMCRIGDILDLADRRGLVVVEDASQAMGATWRGRSAGSFGRAAAMSLNMMKVLAACGEAGVVLTRDGEFARKVTTLRYNGQSSKVDCEEPSANHRLDTIQAAILTLRLERLDEILAARRRIAELYDKELAGEVEVPLEAQDARDSYYAYVLRTDARDALQESLGRDGIETKIHYPRLVTQQTAYLDRRRQRCPVAEREVQRILSLPCHENMTLEDAHWVVRRVLGFFGKA